MLTGFLGSGKTTLLVSYLSAPEAAGTGVIVNEVGQVGIDQHLVETVREEVLLLAGGCACCALRDDLVEALERLERAQAARGQPLERVVLETTGLADPAPIVGSLVKDPRLRGRLELGGVIVALDATRGLALLDELPEARRQAELADRVVLTKTDLLAPEALDALEEQVAHALPARPLRRAAHGALEPAFLHAPPAAGARELSAAALARWLDAPLHTDDEAPVTSLLLELPSPAQVTPLQQWLEMVTHLDGQRLLRIKGLVDPGTGQAPVLLQSVQHVAFPPRALAGAARGWTGSRLVVLARGASPALLDALRATAREAALGTARG